MDFVLKKPLPLATLFGSVPVPIFRELPRCNKNNNWFLFVTLRSSCPEVFCKKGVLRNFTKFTGKHLCLSLFFNKVASLFVKFCEISKNTFLHRAPLVAASIVKHPYRHPVHSYLSNQACLVISIAIPNIESAISEDWMELGCYVFFAHG